MQCKQLRTSQDSRSLPLKPCFAVPSSSHALRYPCFVIQTQHASRQHPRHHVTDQLLLLAAYASCPLDEDLVIHVYNVALDLVLAMGRFLEGQQLSCTTPHVQESASFQLYHKCTRCIISSTSVQAQLGCEPEGGALVHPRRWVTTLFTTGLNPKP